MALLKYMKKEVRPSFKPSVLTLKDNEAAQISVAKAVSALLQRGHVRVDSIMRTQTSKELRLESMQWRMVQLM